jgi:hypothetical protein
MFCNTQPEQAGPGLGENQKLFATKSQKPARLA